MRIKAYLVLVLIALVSRVVAAEKSETRHLDFVQEFIRELAANEDVRASGEQEVKDSTQEDRFSVEIHSSAAIQLELKSQISALKQMRLNAPYDDLIPNIISAYEDKIALHQQLIEIATKFLGGPKDGVDYGKLASEVPQIRAKLEFLDETLFKITPLIFTTLIDRKPDSKDHASHLIITKAERAKLIDDINTSFGAKLDGKNQNYIVSSAWALKGLLLKDFKCSDDPWE